MAISGVNGGSVDRTIGGTKYILIISTVRDVHG